MKITAILAFATTLVAALSVERNVQSHEVTGLTDAKAAISSFFGTNSACDKADEADCTAYCKESSGASAACKAEGNKITCYCKGAGGDPSEKCEDRCLLCMPGKSALEEAKELFRLGGSRMDEL